jgi:excisionase family DNA binding protein
MKNPHNPQNPQIYVSTSQAAKTLGLSVGTVQRMVQSGVFKAFVTHGGHRRILSESVMDYCKGQGFNLLYPLPEAHPGRSLVCVLHDGEHLSQALDTLAHWPHIKVMTHPLDLIDITQNVDAFFMDARIPWLHTSAMHLQNARMQQAHIVIYNCTCLPDSSTLHQAPHLSLFEGDISTDLVDGYLLSPHHAHESRKPTH